MVVCKGTLGLRLKFWVDSIRYFHLALECGIKSIFYVVVRAAGQEFSNLRPLVAEFLVQPNYCLVFLRCPLVFLDFWVQVVVPPLAALFPDSPGKSLRDVAPVLCSELRNIFREFLILFYAPWSFDHRRIENLLPPMEALDVGALVQVRGDPLPVFCAKPLDELS